MFDAIIFTLFIISSFGVIFGICIYHVPAPNLSRDQGAIFCGFLIAMILITILLTRSAMGVI